MALQLFVDKLSKESLDISDDPCYSTAAEKDRCFTNKIYMSNPGSKLDT